MSPSSMDIFVLDSFDPYHEWLGLSNLKGRPDHYVLLSLQPYENDADSIHHAADQAMAQVRGFRPGERAQQWAALLDELKQAKTCLLDDYQRRTYDEQLRFEEISPSVPEADLNSDRSPQAGAKDIHPLYPPGMGGNPADIPQTASTPLPSPRPLPVETCQPAAPELAATEPVPMASPVSSGWGAWAVTSPPSEVVAPTPDNTAPTQPMASTAQPQQQAVGSSVPMASPVVGAPFVPGMSDGNTVPQAPPVGNSSGQSLNSPSAEITSPDPPMTLMAGAASPVENVASPPSAPVPINAAVPLYEVTGGYPANPSAATPRNDLDVHSPANTIPLLGPKSLSMSPGMAIGFSITGVLLIAAIIVGAANLGKNASSNRPVAQIDNDTPRSPVQAVPDPVADLAPVPAVPVPAPAPVSEPERVPEPAPDPEPEPSIPPTPAEISAVEKILFDVREALATRELALAESELSRASELATKPKLLEMVARWRHLHALIADFWIAVDESRLLLQVDQQLQVGSSTVVTVVESSQEELVISTAFGRKKRYGSTFEISSGVAVALAEQSLEPGAAQTQLILGAFFAIDPIAANVEDAMHYWAEAQRLGKEIASLSQILGEPTEVVSIPPPDPEVPPPPMEGVPLSPAQLAHLSELLTTAHLALREREFIIAAESLEQAKRFAVSPEHKALVRRLELLAHYVEEFWSAYRESLASKGDGQEFEFGNRIIVLVEIRPNVLIIRSAGRNLTYSDKSVPAGLAMALANDWLDPGAVSTRVVRGALYAVDPAGSNDRARQAWKEAQFMGADVEDLLLVLDDTYDNLQAAIP